VVVKLRQRIRFYQQLAVLVRAGLPIRAGLVRLKEKMATKEVTALSEKVNAGERIGEAFAAAAFSPFECHLVTAGEKSAQLDTVFEHLAEFWTRELEMRQALIRPLYYPLAVLHFAVVIWGVLDATMKSSVPEAVVHTILRFAALYVFGFVAYTLARVTWSSEAMRGFWLWIPVIGNSIKTAYAYRWISALKLEFTAGISLSRAVGDAWRASGYVGCDRLAEEGEQEMRQGVELSKLVARWKQLPRDWIDFIETGEISGAFETAFKNLEAEAARAWRLAQERMADWLPKIVYFVVLLMVAGLVAKLVYEGEIAPIVDAEKQIDDAVGK
jgi:type II secretory pathway component PulF